MTDIDDTSAARRDEDGTEARESYALHPVGRIRSALHALDEAPRQGSEGAPDAWLDVDPAFARALFRVAPGDELKVHVRVVEGSKERVQVFQGAVIRRQGDGLRETFTVRKVSFGVGVERTFPVHSPIVEKIEVAVRGDVRRAKLYYLRDRIGKAAKIKEKRV